MVVRITKEDERLLEEYSQAASKSSEKLVYVNAIMISSIPIWLFFGVHKMPLVANSVLFAIISLASTFLMSLAYKNSKAPLMERIAIRRTEAITKEVNSEACKDKKLSKKNREDIVRERTKKLLITSPRPSQYFIITAYFFYFCCSYLLFSIISRTRCILYTC
uniref:Translocon-associated protein subunit gamma n=1 Tax=Schistosoma japonicum TaxID=6182 RepID=C1L7R9_SCHJA|nr:Translocon-associated protein subunit gamma [Schistosoma japonicum]CAX70748.1 Translocon-associated protein subunit gamma [Schistosoma japonicum]